MHKKLPWELFIWLLAIVLLWSSEADAAHSSLCPLYNLGLDWCPGCGLGRSVSLFLQGSVKESIAMHWFGIPAFIILLRRIFTLSKAHFKKERLHYKNI